MNLEQRIRKLEEKVGLENKEPTMIVIVIRPTDKATEPHFEEDVGQWVTYGQTYNEERRSGTYPCIFIADPFTEYEVRHGLEPGTLANHPLKGQVVFDKLLAQATGETGDTGRSQTKLDETGQE